MTGGGGDFIQFGWRVTLYSPFFDKGWEYLSKVIVWCNTCVVTLNKSYNLWGFLSTITHGVSGLFDPHQLKKFNP